MAAFNLQGTNTTAEAMNAANAGGDSYPLPADVVLRARNANVGVARNITVVAQKACSHGFLHDKVITVPANSTVYYTIPGGDDRFRDATGRVQLTYDNPADVTHNATPA